MKIKQLKERQSQILETLGVETASELTRKNNVSKSQLNLIEEYNSIRLILSII